MPWLELRFECGVDVAEAFSDALIEQGALSVSVEDADAGTVAEQAMFGEPGMRAEGAWRRNRVIALVDLGVDTAALAGAAANAAGLAVVPPCVAREIADRDWVRLTQSQFDPIRISRRLWIVPTWHEVQDPDAITIRLDPGLAFGTGSHATTRLCLRWLDTNLLPGQSLIDYGCGSGILAIAAARLGACSVLATDIDAQALGATRDNASANACMIDVRGADSMAGRRADVVVANILTNPLRLLAPALVGHLNPGGRLTLSGILDSQEAEVIAAYAPLIALHNAGREDGWICLTGNLQANAG